MKKNKDSLFKDLKIYNLVMTNIWQFLTIIAIGILAGYLFEKYATNPVSYTHLTLPTKLEV